MAFLTTANLLIRSLPGVPPPMSRSLLNQSARDGRPRPSSVTVVVHAAD